MNITTNRITITPEESKTCKLDGKMFSSSRLLINYVKAQYGLSFENYIIRCYYNGIRPVCLKTGKPLSFKAHKLGPWFADTSKNNFMRHPHSEETKQKIKIGCEKKSMELYGVKNPFQSEKIKLKIKQTNLKRYGEDNPAKNNDIKLKALNTYYDTIKKNFESGKYSKRFKRSSLEIDFENKLKSAYIEFVSPFILDGKKFDFFIKALDTIVEIDGEAFHKNSLVNLSLINISTAINDYEKNELAKSKGKKLTRIRWNLDLNFTNVRELEIIINEQKYYPDYSMSFRQPICNKLYFSNYIKTHNKDKLKEYVYMFVKFIKIFNPNFPKIESYYSIDYIKTAFNSFEYHNIISNDSFLSQKCPKVANYFLKSIFLSYWQSAYKNKKSPVESWNDIEMMKKIIEYRIGCNESNEIFDFSLFEIIQGMSARRLTVSFFNPFLAFSIYKHLLGNQNTPVVIDPCCGFGGRLLGFKMAYPNGKYIGYEPNNNTFNELNELIKLLSLKDVILYNHRYEDSDTANINCDLVFTSIPYYDKEQYGTNEITRFDEWKDTFIKKIIEKNNTYINCSIQLANMLGWTDNLWKTITFTTSHFDAKQSLKFEGIYKFTK